jgi:hypothetical protein
VGIPDRSLEFDVVAQYQMLRTVIWNDFCLLAPLLRLS